MMCRCESSLCWHSEEGCPETENLRPAPVRYLFGEMMCETCIQHYVAAGYGT